MLVVVVVVVAVAVAVVKKSVVLVDDAKVEGSSLPGKDDRWRKRVSHLYVAVS